MTVDELIEFYTTAQLAGKALGVSAQGVADWRKQGFIPFNTQYRIQVLSGGVLVADREDKNPRHLRPARTA